MVSQQAKTHFEGMDCEFSYVIISFNGSTLLVVRVFLIRAKIIGFSAGVFVVHEEIWPVGEQITSRKLGIK